MKKSKGFTLIELMVVIVILGILAAVIAPRIPGFVGKAKEGRTKGNLGNLRSALNIYYSDNDGSYPRTASLGTLLSPKYLKEVPKSETPGIAAHPDPSNAVADDAVGTVLVNIGDAVGWIYNSNSAGNVWGDIYVNCNAHKDNAGTGLNAWSSF